MTMGKQTVIVTGAANGIGKEISRSFSHNGAEVVLADIDSENGKKLEKEILQENGDAFFVETDVKKEEDIVRLVELTIQKYGKIDVVINNAGIDCFENFFELTTARWDEVINTNLRSVFLLAREAGRFMQERGGSIINIASTRAFMSEPNSESYAASKGGVIALTHALAATLSPYRIRVNSISPGWIHHDKNEKLSKEDHEQHWSGRVGRPEDIAEVCLMLADPKNDFINGENITVDGGMTKKMIYL